VDQFAARRASVSSVSSPFDKETPMKKQLPQIKTSKQRKLMLIKSNIKAGMARLGPQK
jgi:hypothetical protein